MGVGILAAVKACWMMLSGGAYLAGAWLIAKSVLHARSAHVTQQGGIGKSMGSMGGGILLIAGPSFFGGVSMQIFGSSGGDMFSAGSGTTGGAELMAAVLGFLQLACGAAMLVGAWSLSTLGEQGGSGWKSVGLIFFGGLGVNYKLTIAGICQLIGTTNPLTYFGLS